MTFGFLILAHNNWEYVKVAAPLAPVVGFTRTIWDLRGRLAELVGQGTGRLYYRPLHAGRGAPDWSEDFAHRTLEYQVDKWFELFVKDGMDFEEFINDLDGHRPLIQIFNEPRGVLNDMPKMWAYSEFSAALAKRIWHLGGQAALGGWSTGVLNRGRVAHMEPMLAVCRGDNPIAVFEYHEYAPIWPAVWLGRNQSESVPVEATNDEKWAAVWRDPVPMFTDPHDYLPAYLIGRNMGLPFLREDTSVGWGIPELYDVNMMQGEGVVDNIPDLRLPVRNNGDQFGGVNSTVNAVEKRLGIPSHEVAVEGFRLVDNLLDHMKGPGGRTKVPIRVAFCFGDGFGWDGYNFVRTQRQFEAYVSYLGG